MSARIIFITGANGGLGQAMASAFLEGDAQDSIVLGVHRRRDAAENLANRFPGRVFLQSLDVSQPTGWQTAVKEIVQLRGRVDVLVNNAGTHEDGLLATMSPAAWDSVLSTNLNAVFHGCQAVLPSMISQRFGRIVNIASLSALLAPAGQSNYAAAKAGVIAMTQSLAKEVARIGITVNAICPGYIETEALAAMSPEEKKAAAARVPMRRLGRPEEVAVAVRFLAGRDASYITGSILKIDGGIL